MDINCLPRTVEINIPINRRWRKRNVQMRRIISSLATQLFLQPISYWETLRFFSDLSTYSALGFRLIQAHTTVSPKDGMMNNTGCGVKTVAKQSESVRIAALALIKEGRHRATC
jgi:hypothetical protein